LTLQQIKKCPGCGEWFSFYDLRDHAEIEPRGMMIDPKDSDHCSLHFVHRKPGCDTPFVVSSLQMVHLLGLNTEQKSAFGDQSCPGNCMRLEDLTSCAVSCRLQVYREFLLTALRARSVGRKALVEVATAPLSLK
jgi:hypothetical protein